MKKVFQTVHGRGKGNCLPAVIASLLEILIDDVPDFNSTENWYQTLIDFMESHGYQRTNGLYNPEEARIRGYMEYYEENKDKPSLDLLKNYEGIDGLFYADIYSPGNYNANDELPAMHAVVIDKDCNIIHDPEEKYQSVKEYPRSKELGFNGVIDVTIFEKVKL